MINITGATLAELEQLREALLFTCIWDEDQRGYSEAKGEEYVEEQDPDRLIPKWIDVVEEAIREKVSRDFDRPRDGEAWSGGFADNH